MSGQSKNRSEAAGRDRTPGLVGPSRAQHQQQVLVRRANFDPAFVAVGVVAHQQEPNGSRPEVQRGLLVAHRDDDLPHTGDHDQPPDLRRCNRT